MYFPENQKNLFTVFFFCRVVRGSKELISVKMQVQEENKQNSTISGALLCVVETPIPNFSFHVYRENWNESQCL